MSAAALVRRPGGDVFVKRHDPRVRTARQLAAEHAFLTYLREHGEPVPAVRRTPEGASVLRRGGFVYEVHDVAPGLDLYRDAVSWSPYRSWGTPGRPARRWPACTGRPRASPGRPGRRRSWSARVR